MSDPIAPRRDDSPKRGASAPPEPSAESPEADQEFERVLRNLVNTPHKPHEKKGREPKPAPTDKA